MPFEWLISKIIDVSLPMPIWLSLSSLLRCHMFLHASNEYGCQTVLSITGWRIPLSVSVCCPRVADDDGWQAGDVPADEAGGGAVGTGQAGRPDHIDGPAAADVEPAGPRRHAGGDAGRGAAHLHRGQAAADRGQAVPAGGEGGGERRGWRGAGELHGDAGGRQHRHAGGRAMRGTGGDVCDMVIGGRGWHGDRGDAGDMVTGGTWVAWWQGGRWHAQSTAIEMRQNTYILFWSDILHTAIIITTILGYEQFAPLLTVGSIRSVTRLSYTLRSCHRQPSVCRRRVTAGRRPPARRPGPASSVRSCRPAPCSSCSAPSRRSRWPPGSAGVTPACPPRPPPPPSSARQTSSSHNCRRDSRAARVSRLIDLNCDALRRLA